MGTEIPDPIIPGDVAAGNPCSICWGFGKAFGNVDTPSILTLNFSGINKADDWFLASGEPLEGAYDIPQTMAEPCAFQAFIDGMTFQLQFVFGRTELTVITIGGVDKFVNINADECEDLIPNDMISQFTGGTCAIIFPRTV